MTPFLYFSKSRQRLDELRFSLGDSSKIGNDTDISFDGHTKRKGRFSTEVHPIHNAMLAGMMDDIEHVLECAESIEDWLDDMSI